MTEETNVVAPVFGNVSIADPEALAKTLEDTQDEGGRAGDISFMSFSGKKGRYQIGVDKREPAEGEPFLLAITSFELGWICWKGGKPVSKRMANVSAPAIQQPDPEEFGPFDRDGEGWHRARAITVRSMDNGEQCYFSLNSKSGVAAISDLQREVVARIKSGQASWPVINFGSEDFEAQGYNNSKPVMECVQWIATEDVQKMADPEFDPMSLIEEGAVEEKPKPRRRL